MKHIIKNFDTISLEKMDKVRLMDRIDTKFIFSSELLPGILEKASANYKILEEKTGSIFTYSNLYFDTPEFDMYTIHHNRHLNRYKVRFREYVDSGIIFLEVKFKNNKRRTIKTRIKRAAFEDTLIGESADFINQLVPYEAKNLIPGIRNRFNRITLVHKTVKERITIDTGLQFTGNNKEYKLPFLAIAEVKHSRYSSRSDFIDLLLDQRIFPQGLSKYLLGVVLTCPGIKYNRYKPKLLILKQISHGQFNHQLIS